MEEKVENLGEKEAVSGSVGLARGWLAVPCTHRETMGIVSENVALDPWALRSDCGPETKLWALPFPLVSHSAPVTIGRTLRHALGKGVQAVWFCAACLAIMPLLQHAAFGLRHSLGYCLVLSLYVTVSTVDFQGSGVSQLGTSVPGTVPQR